jgi:hypothetical protein
LADADDERQVHDRRYLSEASMGRIKVAGTTHPTTTGDRHPTRRFDPPASGPQRRDQRVPANQLICIRPGHAMATRVLARYWRRNKIVSERYKID